MSASMQVEVSGHVPTMAERFVAALDGYRIRRQHARAIRALSGLNDHMLKDIGIPRCGIQTAVRGRGE